MKEILQRAEPEDFEFLVRVMRSPLHLRGTEDMYERLVLYREEASPDNRDALAAVIEREVRYAGSADLAYATRWVLRREPGITTDRIIHDVAKRLKVRVPTIGPVGAKLESLAEGVMAKELFKLSPEEQQELIQKQGMDPKAAREVMSRIHKHGPFVIVPVLLSILGREALEELVTGLVTKAIGRLLGRDAARHLIANLVTRFPAWSGWLGPAVWGVTGVWAVLDVQGPAYRKTIPAVLYTSLIAVRRQGKKKRKKHLADSATSDEAKSGELADAGDEGGTPTDLEEGAGVASAPSAGESEGSAAEFEEGAGDSDAAEPDAGVAPAKSPKGSSSRGARDDASDAEEEADEKD